MSLHRWIFLIMHCMSSCHLQVCFALALLHVLKELCSSEFQKTEHKPCASEPASTCIIVMSFAVSSVFDRWNCGNIDAIPSWQYAFENVRRKPSPVWSDWGGFLLTSWMCAPHILQRESDYAPQHRLTGQPPPSPHRFLHVSINIDWGNFISALPAIE